VHVRIVGMFSGIFAMKTEISTRRRPGSITFPRPVTYPPDSLTPLLAAVRLHTLSYKGDRTLTSYSRIRWAILASAAILSCGCSVSHRTAVKPSAVPAQLQTASKDQLIAQYNHQVQAVDSLHATVSLKVTAGSAYSGVIEQYHEINAIIVAARPASIRMIGQVPVVGKNIFDMVSDGTTFAVSIPSKNKFITGPSNFERKTGKPVENLRPQHLLDAFLWAPIPDGAPVLLEEVAQDVQRFYVLTVIRGTSPADFEIDRRIYFDRSDLHLARIESFAPAGRLISDATYSGSIPAGNTTYPTQIVLSRPAEDYKIEMEVKKIAINEPVTPEQFVLRQPPGSDLVRVGDDSKEQHP
jgi:hypothetical protein